MASVRRCLNKVLTPCRALVRPLSVLTRPWRASIRAMKAFIRHFRTLFRPIRALIVAPNVGTRPYPNGVRPYCSGQGSIVGQSPIVTALRPFHNEFEKQTQFQRFWIRVRDLFDILSTGFLGVSDFLIHFRNSFNTFRYGFDTCSCFSICSNTFLTLCLFGFYSPTPFEIPHIRSEL